MHEARPQLKTQHPDEADGEVLVALRGPARAERLKDIRAAVESALAGTAPQVRDKERIARLLDGTFSPVRTDAWQDALGSPA